MSVTQHESAPFAGRRVHPSFCVSAGSGCATCATSFSRRDPRPSFADHHDETTKDKRGRRSAERRIHPMAAPTGRSAGVIGARSPSGAPPRHLPKHIVSAQLRAAFPGITGCKREDPPRRQCSEHLADRSLCRPSRCPKPPGSRVTSPTRGNRTRSAIRCVSRSRPSVSELRGICIRNGRACQ
jgi:hypothetical protein